jgi:hypothetical protein
MEPENAYETAGEETSTAAQSWKTEKIATHCEDVSRSSQVSSNVILLPLLVESQGRMSRNATCSTNRPVATPMRDRYVEREKISYETSNMTHFTSFTIIAKIKIEKRGTKWSSLIHIACPN